MTVEDDVLAKIRPTKAERDRVDKAARDLRGKVQEYIDREDIDAEIRFAGSYSKDTFLSDPDIDLFVLFPPSLPKKELERIGLKIGDEVLHGVRMFSEHPYTRGRYEGVDVDLVPSYHLASTEHIQTAVDRTPFHTRFVKESMAPEQHDQTRLLKKFMKGIGAYGAEPMNRGFSGYLCELLTIRYGSFRGVLKAAATEWKEGVAIEIRGKGPKIDSALVVYDPVDNRRNVASAVHADTLALFIAAARDYLAEPSERFFFPAERKPMLARDIDSAASDRGSRLLTVTFARPDGVEETLHSQVWKTQYAIAKKLDDLGFGVLRAEHSVGDERVEIAYELVRDTLPKTLRHAGPPVWVRTSDKFLARWKGNPYGEPFIENGAWCVIAERPYTSAEDMVRAEAPVAGIGKNFDIGTMEVLGHEGSLERCDPLLLTDLMFPVFRWKVRRARNSRSGYRRRSFAVENGGTTGAVTFAKSL